MRSLNQVGFRNAANICHQCRRVVTHRSLERIKSFGMGANVSLIDHPFPQQDVQHAVEQCDIGAGQNWQVQVGKRCGVGAARVNHDHLHPGAILFRLLDAAEQDRMGISSVRAGDEQCLGKVHVVVTGRRRIGTERGFVADHRARHA